MCEDVQLFKVGEYIDFNELGRSAQVNLPPPNGTPWKVQAITPAKNPAAPHPQLIDLGPGYSIGPVSGMFLTRK